MDPRLNPAAPAATDARPADVTPSPLARDEQALLQNLRAMGPKRHQWIEKSGTYYQDLKRFFAFHVAPHSTVLELGFGVGSVLEACKPRQGMGLDLSEEACTEARKRYPAQKFAVWDGMRPLPAEVLNAYPNGVDYILLVNTVGFWPDIQKALGHLKPLCRPHTRIIASYYNFLWAPVFRIAQALRLKMPQPELNWLSADDVANLFSISGFRVLKQGYRCLMPVNLWPLSSLVNRYLTPLPGFNSLGCTHFVISRVPATIDRRTLKVSVLIPARNEKGNMEPALRRLSAVAARRPEVFETIFVEGNSSDDTWGEIERCISDPSVPKPGPVALYKQPGKGKGDAVRTGFAKATGDLLMILDADLTMPPEDLDKFIDAWADGHGEFINGCRLVYKMEKEAMRPLNLMGNKFFSWAFTWLLGQRFKDTLCGTKVLSKANYERIVAGRAYFGNFDPFGDFDLIFGASKLDLEIAEVPIRYKERVYGETNISRWKHGWLLLKMCIFAMNKIKFVP
jgi:SAM-dependent methyltransferase